MQEKNRSIEMLKVLQENGFGLEDLIGFLEQLDPEKSANRTQGVRRKKIENRIREKLLELGVPQHINGYQYLVTAIKEVYEEPEMLHKVTKQLYSTIAEKYESTASKVERCIRHAVETSTDRTSSEIFYKYFGYSVSPLKGKPTNSEFFAAVVGILRAEDEA